MVYVFLLRSSEWQASFGDKKRGRLISLCQSDSGRISLTEFGYPTYEASGENLDAQIYAVPIKLCIYTSRKHAYIILTPLNPTFI